MDLVDRMDKVDGMDAVSVFKDRGISLMTYLGVLPVLTFNGESKVCFWPYDWAE